MDKEQRSKKFYLKWPWNLIVYILLVVLLRLFAVPVILALMAWNKKQQPDGPEEGYCLQRTRNRLGWLGWSLLYLVIALCCGAVFFMQLGQDRADWDFKDWATLIICGAIALGATLLCIYETYAVFRDVFFPEKSRLAQSIRSQLPYPDEAPGVKELFAMVDQDIRENGQWFDRVAVGKEWVLGDDVSALDRVRVISGRNEIVRRHNGNRVQSTRIVELHILDDRQQIQLTGLRDPRELDALLNCLKLRAPEAIVVPYSQFSDYAAKSDEEWEELEREYRNRQAQRKQGEAERDYAAAQSNPDFAFTGLDGQRTSCFDQETIASQLAQLKQEGQFVRLEAFEPIPVPGLSGVSLSGVAAGMAGEKQALFARLKMADGGEQTLLKAAGEQEVRETFANLLGRRQLPDFSNLSLWTPIRSAGQSQQPLRRKLIYSDSRGATREFTSFSRRDVELAGEGLSDGKYKVVALYAGPRYLYLQAGDQTDGRVTVNAGRPDADELRVFEIKCTHRQAVEWLLAMHDGRFAPDFSQWQDITKKLQKQAKK